MGKGLADLAAIVGNTASQPFVSEKAVEKPKSEFKSKADKFDALKALEKQLNKQFECSFSIVRLGSKVGIPIPSIATNLPTLDYDVLQCGGIPRGRLIEIFGPESSGKTTICLHIVAQEQSSTDNLVAYIDAEHSLDPTYAARLGVNVDELLISQPDSGEQALTTADALIDSKAVSLIVIDSVAALVPQAELDGEMGDSNMGLQARLMSQACRKLRGKAAANNVTLIFINQIREKIGVMFGSPETTTGGRALKFFASVRLDTRRKEVIGDKEHPIGHVIKVKAVKNKVGSPMRETLIDLLYDTGIDTFKDFVEYAAKLGVIEKSGSWYNFAGERLGQGMENTKNAITANPDLFEKIHLTVEEARVKVNTDGKE
jgi:recombination protein RecA